MVFVVRVESRRELGPLMFAGVRRRASARSKPCGAGVFGHLLQRGMHAQDDVFQLIQFLRGFLFSQNCGRYLAAEFVGNGHDEEWLS